MLSIASAVKQEDDSSNEQQMKDDDPETTGIASIKTEPVTALKEVSGSPTKSEDSAADSISDDAVMKEKADGTIKNKDTEEDIPVKTETDTESESSSVHAESSEDKSISNNWDNGYSNELQKMYSNVDADTRAVAEEMIRAAAGHQTKPSKPEDVPKAPPLSTPASATTAKPITAEDASQEASKSGVSNLSPSAPKNTNTTVINKGKEPSALELALKQQGISQSDQLRSTQFPFRLHNMLDDAERSGHAHIVSWCAGGDSFKIHKPPKLIHVLQKYFRQSKFKSFLRQLQGYNFKRITRGKDQGVVSHPLFLKGRRSVSTLMRRKRVGPKAVEVEQSQANKIAAVAARNLSFNKKASTTNDDVANHVASRQSNAVTPILPQSQLAKHGLVRRAPPTVLSSPTYPIKVHNPSMQSSQAVAGVINPNPQDVLCVEYPNAQTAHQFQGNRKLASIVQKITGHYTSANESVRTMIVNEISSRIQNSGSRFLKLGKGGLSWMECNREEMFRKVISCFEQEIQGSKEKNHIDLTGGIEAPTSGVTTINKPLSNMGNPNMHGSINISSDLRRMPPRDQDVVLRGGPGSEREGNTYLKTMIQANVGQQLDSFEMKRIKCRAILERMKRRGSRFFLKLKDTDTDDEMYVLSDAEAQDVIYTAFCAEEKKVQSHIVETSTASAMLRAKALAELEGSHPGLSGLGGGVSQYASRVALQSDAALLSQLKANNDMNMLASQGSLKRPLTAHAAHLSHENIIEKRLRAETDEHIKMLIERERHRRNDPYSSVNSLAGGLAGRLPFNTRGAVLESSMPMTSAYGGAAAAAANSSTIDQFFKERQADEMLLKSAQAAAAARSPFAVGPSPSGLGGELPKSSSNNHFVEFLKKKYVKSAQERAW